MDWRHVGFDWNQARAFLATAEAGSFSGAARALGVAQPTIGRQIAALEEELGVTLVERFGRGVRLTSAGIDLAEQVRVMSEAAMRISLLSAGQATSLEGLVRVSASEVIAASKLPRVVERIRAEYPGIQLEIIATNDVSDLRARDADVAVRSFRPTDPELVAVKVDESVARLYGSPDYVDSLGPIALPADLSRASFFGFDHSELMIEGLRHLGVETTSRNFPIVSGNHLVQWEMAKRGLGICFMVQEIGDAEPALQRVLGDTLGMPVPTWITSHRELKTSRRQRVVFDALVDALKPNSD